MVEAERQETPDVPMPNPLQGEIVIQSKRGAFLLRLGMAELAKLEKELGIDSFVEAFDMVQGQGEKPSMTTLWKVLSTILKVGLNRHHSDMSDEAIEDVVFELGVSGLMRAIVESASRINKDADEAKKIDQPKAGPDPNVSAAMEVSATS